MASSFTPYSPAGAAYSSMMRRDLARDTDRAGSGPAAPSTLQDAPVGLQAVPGMVDGLAGEAAQAVEVPFKRVRKKMAILLMSYSGTGFNGMQIQPDGGTIENALLDALFAAGMITEENNKKIQTMNFQRCARTDKGVHAARQVVSLKMAVDEPDIVSRVNAQLPAQIRIMAYMRAPRSFNAKNQCTGRRYQYLAPSYAFCPKGPLTEADLSFRIDEEKLALINTVLGGFVGTRNYHNFTSKKTAEDPSAMRYIVSFECNGPVVIDGVEFVKMTVCGQSFLLHMIRKMVGLTMAIVRGYATVDVMETAFSPAKLDVPRAPGLGLLLDACFFDVYNRKYKNDKDHPPIGWPELDPAIDAFKHENIFSEMVKTEVSERIIFSWLDTISCHTFEAHALPPSADDDESAQGSAAAAGGAAGAAPGPRWVRSRCYSTACTSDGRCYSTMCQQLDQIASRKRKKYNQRGFGAQHHRKRPKR